MGSGSAGRGVVHLARAATSDGHTHTTHTHTRTTHTHANGVAATAAGGDITTTATIADGGAGADERDLVPSVVERQEDMESQ